MRSIHTALRIRKAGELRGLILDCGCGEGLFGPYLRRPGNTVVSMDMDVGALKQVPGLRVAADCTRLPFQDGCFDAVWACALIEHVQADAVPELMRVTRPGGRLFAFTPNKRSPFDWIKRLVGMRTWDKNPGHVRLYTVAELSRYGPVHGETRFVPFLGRLFWKLPRLAHVLVLDLTVTQQLKAKVSQGSPLVSPARKRAGGEHG